MTEVAESSRFVDNDGVRIHALDNGRLDALLPAVLVVPGMGEYAEEYSWLLGALGERRVVIVDVRGRGRSDVPDAGYRWEDHIGDLHAVVEATGLDRPIVVAFSRGSSYALGYALEHPGELRGLVIGDYFARHVGLPPEIADQQLRSKLRGVPIAERMSEHAVRQVFVEGREVPLWDRLTELRCPVLVIRGGRRERDRRRRAGRAVGGVAAVGRARAHRRRRPRPVEPRRRRLPRGAVAVRGADQRGVNTSGSGSTVRIMVLL